MKEKELNPVIYKTTNLVNGKIYVGQDRYNRAKYLGSGVRLRSAIKHYGKEQFKKEILEYCVLELLNEREQDWIKELDSMNPEIGYNLTKGGDGVDMTEETKKKISNSKLGNPGYWLGKKRPGIADTFTRKGIKPSIETRLKLSDSLKGHIVTEITRLKLRKPKGPQKIIKCPHCNKEGGISNMHRRHFDNCKYSP